MKILTHEVTMIAKRVNGRVNMGKLALRVSVSSLLILAALVVGCGRDKAVTSSNQGVKSQLTGLEKMPTRDLKRPIINSILDQAQELKATPAKVKEISAYMPDFDYSYNPSNGEAVVTAISESSPFYKAGLKEGMVFTIRDFEDAELKPWGNVLIKDWLLISDPHAPNADINSVNTYTYFPESQNGVRPNYELDCRPPVTNLPCLSCDELQMVKSYDAHKVEQTCMNVPVRLRGRNPYAVVDAWALYNYICTSQASMGEIAEQTLSLLYYNALGKRGFKQRTPIPNYEIVYCHKLHRYFLTLVNNFLLPTTEKLCADPASDVDKLLVDAYILNTILGAHYAINYPNMETFGLNPVTAVKMAERARAVYNKCVDAYNKKYALHFAEIERRERLPAERLAEAKAKLSGLSWFEKRRPLYISKDGVAFYGVSIGQDIEQAFDLIKGKLRDKQLISWKSKNHFSYFESKDDYNSKDIMSDTNGVIIRLDFSAAQVPKFNYKKMADKIIEEKNSSRDKAGESTARWETVTRFFAEKYNLKFSGNMYKGEAVSITVGDVGSPDPAYAPVFKIVVECNIAEEEYEKVREETQMREDEEAKRVKEEARLREEDRVRQEYAEKSERTSKEGRERRAAGARKVKESRADSLKPTIVYRRGHKDTTPTSEGQPQVNDDSKRFTQAEKTDQSTTERQERRSGTRRIKDSNTDNLTQAKEPLDENIQNPEKNGAQSDQGVKRWQGVRTNMVKKLWGIATDIINDK